MIDDIIGSLCVIELGYNLGIELRLSDRKVLGNILGNVDVITICIDIGTCPGSSDGSFDGYNYVKLEGLLIGESLGYTDGEVLGSDEGIKL